MLCILDEDEDICTLGFAGIYLGYLERRIWICWTHSKILPSNW
jgi:hypothetical protein